MEAASRGIRFGASCSCRRCACPRPRWRTFGRATCCACRCPRPRCPNGARAGSFSPARSRFARARFVPHASKGGWREPSRDDLPGLLDRSCRRAAGAGPGRRARACRSRSPAPSNRDRLPARPPWKGTWKDASRSPSTPRFSILPCWEKDRIRRRHGRNCCAKSPKPRRVCCSASRRPSAGWRSSNPRRPPARFRAPSSSARRTGPGPSWCATTFTKRVKRRARRPRRGQLARAPARGPAFARAQPWIAVAAGRGTGSHPAFRLPGDAVGRD